jgi:hypothetical protein
MESRNERHLTMEQLHRLVLTVRTLIACGRSIEQVTRDLIQSHGLTKNDVADLTKLV